MGTKYTKYFRHPKTAQEKRADPEPEPVSYRVRAKRNRANLVDAWDEIHNASIEDKSWKHKRKHKYRTDGKEQFHHYKRVFKLRDRSYHNLLDRLERFDYHYTVKHDYRKDTTTVEWYGKDVS